MYAYCANNPIMHIDPSGYKWNWGTMGWIAAGVVVVGLAVAVIITAGGAAPAAFAVVAALNGVASASMATTVLSFAFIGSATALAGSAAYAYSYSSNAEEFASYGEDAMWNTSGGGAFGALGGYLSYKEQIGNSSQAGFMSKYQRDKQRNSYWISKGYSDGKAPDKLQISHIYGTYGNNRNYFIIQNSPDHRAFHSIYGYKTNGGPFHRPNPYYHDWWDNIRGLLGYQ